MELETVWSGNTWRTYPQPEVGATAMVRTDPRQKETTAFGRALVAHSLKADGFDASEDGTGRGTPLVAEPYTLAIRGRGDSHNLEYRQDGIANAILTPNGGRGGIGVGAVAFDARQSDVIQYGDKTGQLDTDGHTIAVAFYENQGSHGGGQQVELAPTLKGGKTSNFAAVDFSVKDYGADAGDIAPTLRAGGHTSSHANGGVMPAVAFAQNQRDEVRLMDVAGALASEPGMKQQTYIGQHMAVRRLTPRECARLQGFPDDYLDIIYRGKPAADGNKYKALGNSMAVPVMQWIGKRIQMVEDIP